MTPTQRTLPPERPQLFVEKADPEFFSTLAKTVAAWERISREKIKACTTSEKRRFEDSAGICRDLSRLLEQPPEDLAMIYLCRDSKERVQAVSSLSILTDTDGLHLNYLVTHPHNIRSSLNAHHADRVQGAGSLLIQHAEVIAKQRSFNQIEVCPLSSSILFYTKCGFQFNTDLTMVKRLSLRVEEAAFPLLAAS